MEQVAPAPNLHGKLSIFSVETDEDAEIYLLHSNGWMDFPKGLWKKEIVTFLLDHSWRCPFMVWVHHPCVQWLEKSTKTLTDSSLNYVKPQWKYSKGGDPSNLMKNWYHWLICAQITHSVQMLDVMKDKCKSCLRIPHPSDITICFLTFRGLEKQWKVLSVLLPKENWTIN